MENNHVNSVKMAMLAVQRYPWEQGVCMQALYELGDETTAMAMAHDAVLRQKEDGRLAVITENIAVTDPAANGIGVWKAYEKTGESMYREAALRMLSYLMEKAPRTENGTLCHNEVSFQEEFSPDQIWADSIYMAPPFLACMGETDEAVRQIRGMMGYLMDPSSGVLRHIYDAGTCRYVRDKLWATGNGWALMGLASVMDHTQELKQTMQDLLDHLLEYQLPDGRFHDILDEKNSFIDGASAMMVAAAIYRGCAGGWLPDCYLPKAELVVHTMENYVDSMGIIHEVCGCPNFVSMGTSAESMAAYLMMHAWRKRCEHHGNYGSGDSGTGSLYR